MQKVVKILEANAEWIAMGLGGVWVLIVVWYWVLTPPALQLGSKTVHPGDIDEEVNHTAVALERQMKTAEVPEMKEPDFAEAFAKSLNSPAQTMVASAKFNSPPAAKALEGIAVANANQQLIDTLPKPLEVSDVATTSGRSQVLPPPPPVAAANGAAANGADAAPAPAVAPVLPPAPAVGPGGAAVVPVNAIDKLWVTVWGKVDQNAWLQAFKDAKLPGWMVDKGQLIFLEVQLERQEVTATGQPIGKPVVVKTLKLTPPTADRVKDPNGFLTWAVANQMPIAEPSFYQTAAGDAWRSPEEVEAAKLQDATQNNQTPWLGPDGKFDAQSALQYIHTLPNAKLQNEFREKLTPEQRQQLYKAEQEEKAKETKQPTPPRGGDVRPPGQRYVPPSRGGRGGRGGAAGYDYTDPSLFKEMFAEERPTNQRYFPRGRRGSFPPGDFGPGPNNMNVPQGGEVPVDAAGKMRIWAHDETVESGKTYIYRMRVIYKNPVYASKNIAVDALTQQMGIPSFDNKDQGWSAWSKPVTIPQVINFWLASGVNPTGNTVRFKVRKWQGAQPHEMFFTVAPGDLIGGMDKASGIDYSTGWTLDDARPIGTSDARVTLANDSGEVVTRTRKGDEVEANKTLPAPVPAGGPGAVGVVPGGLGRP